jgi:hypothetical protein
MAKNSLEHALHNESVCKYLNKKPECADWVITTAFYSSLHFLRSKIFPLNLTENGKTITFTDFDNYCAAKQIAKGKHRAFSDLVEQKVADPTLAAQFNWLKDLSWTARYNSYEFDRTYSNAALEKLKLIKSFCS